MTPAAKIMEHLATRGNVYMKRSPPFYRSLQPKVGAFLFKQNNEFFEKVVAPAAAAGALAVVEVNPFSTTLAVERPAGGGGGGQRSRKHRRFHKQTRKN